MPKKTDKSNFAIYKGRCPGPIPPATPAVRFSVTNPGGQIIGNVISETLRFPTTEYSTGPFIGPNGTFIVPQSGFYHFDATIGLDFLANTGYPTGNGNFTFAVDGTTISNGPNWSASIYNPTPAGFPFCLSANFSIDLQLTVGQVITIQIFNTGNPNISLLPMRLTGHFL